MEFVAFPIIVRASGWLNRASSPEESLLRLLKVMVSTSKEGWRGSDAFGSHETLAELPSKQSARQQAIRMINQALQELDIDWVSVDDIRYEPSGKPDTLSYLFTLSYVGKGSEVLRFEV